ncbi:chemotaxis protein CheC [candidate division KSB3 bacterium]|uniref:Chemotaxis protein CheC n=1 Tax=candidate division KSB3 bacterium TaxID=2044937 RepID=A0A9D5JVK4_9BACT|nr:chemotaxis protein CheC [candidate division KSB3 bacterium]MBD3324726.1 chemotaxis protein CheC [candidate division KSB3 bacterium]
MSLTAYQLDALTELINIGVGRAAGMLNQILEAHVQLNVPSIQIFPYSHIEHALQTITANALSIVSLGFKGSFSGTALLAFPSGSASQLVDVLTGEESEIEDDLDSIRVGVLTEVGNIVLNGVMGSLSNVLQEHFSYSIPVYIEDTIAHLVDENNLDAESTLILAKTELVIKKFHIKGNIILLFRVGLFNTLIDSLETF